MAKCRFVQPEVVRLQISDGDYIDVKKRLSVGEERAAFQQMVGEVNSEGWRRPNMEMMGIAEMAAYIIGWSLLGPDGRPVPVSVSAIQGLDTESFREIDAALDEHKQKMDAEEHARKNGQTVGGETQSVTISSSAA